jgi:hypothetical protein
MDERCESAFGEGGGAGEGEGGDGLTRLVAVVIMQMLQENALESFERYAAIDLQQRAGSKA